MKGIVWSVSWTVGISNVRSWFVMSKHHQRNAFISFLETTPLWIWQVVSHRCEKYSMRQTRGEGGLCRKVPHGLLGHPKSSPGV